MDTTPAANRNAPEPGGAPARLVPTAAKRRARSGGRRLDAAAIFEDERAHIVAPRWACSRPLPNTPQRAA